MRNSAAKALVNADPHRLQQVFFNLALNAFRAMDEGGALFIEISSAKVPSELRIDFRDVGRGIEPAALGRIFEAGFTTKAGSPGLGLTVCKKIVEQHGGRIEASSRSRQARRFPFFFRFRKDAPADEPRAVGRR